MSEINTVSETSQFSEFEKKALPTGINVLTILTFIGSGFALIMSLLSPWVTKFMLNLMDKSASSGAELTTKQLQDIADGKKALELMQANLYPLMIVGIIGAVLCIIGAQKMRRLKKDGFWIYTGAELFPLFAGFIMMGTAQYTSISSWVIGIGVPVLFIILYAFQRKHLVN